VGFLRGMGRRRKIALLGAACVAVLAALAWIERPRDEPAKATLGEAVRSFRAERDSNGRGGGSGEPALGVYRYRTRGSESVKSPVLGTTHDYDGVSTVVLSRGHCGERERWQVLQGRWTEGELCAGKHGTTAGTVTEFHEFFGTGEKDRFHCRSGATSVRRGSRFSSSCRSEASSISTTSRVVGTAKVYVGDRAFETIHVESHSTFGGKQSGTAIRDEWRRRSDGLLLRRKVESEADTSTAAGSTHYSERYTIQLLSTRPRR
jgi:hypothetical protein